MVIFLENQNQSEIQIVVSWGFIFALECGITFLKGSIEDFVLNAHILCYHTISHSNDKRASFLKFCLNSGIFWRFFIKVINNNNKKKNSIILKLKSNKNKGWVSGKKVVIRIDNILTDCKEEVNPHYITLELHGWIISIKGLQLASCNTLQWPLPGSPPPYL